MPTLTPHAIPSGSLARITQPDLAADGGLLLRPWTPADACALTSLYADPDIRRWHMFAIDTQDEALEMIERWRQRWLAETGAHWAVTAHPDSEPAGRIGLRAMDTQQGIAEVIYSTAPAFRGQGVAPAALEALTSWAFSAGFTVSSCGTRQRTRPPAELPQSPASLVRAQNAAPSSTPMAGTTCTCMLG